MIALEMEEGGSLAVVFDLIEKTWELRGGVTDICGWCVTTLRCGCYMVLPLSLEQYELEPEVLETVEKVLLHTAR